VRVFEGILYDVYQWQQKTFDDNHAIHEMLRRQDTVLVIGIDGDRAMIVNDTQPHRGMLVGFPGGRVSHEDSSTLEAAQRETREETGVSFAHWKLVAVVQPATKVEHFVYAYIAWGVTARDKPMLDAGGEKIDVRWVDYASLCELSGDELPAIVDRIYAAGSIKALIDTPEYVGELVDIATKR